MPIEINGKTTPQTTNAGQGAKLRPVNSEGGNPRAKGDDAPARDSIRLTSDASLMHRLDHQISSLPVVDAQRVEAVRNSIMDGTFSIDPARVAEKLIAAETALQSRGL